MAWVADSVPRYRLTTSIVRAYLKDKWGNKDYRVTVRLHCAFRLNDLQHRHPDPVRSIATTVSTSERLGS